MESERKKKSTWKIWVAACLFATVIVLFPVINLFVAMTTAYHDVESAKAEFKRTVKPDDLRAWVLTQLKSPENSAGYSEKSAKEWPANFPHFPGRRFWVYLYHDSSSSGLDRIQGASIGWDFLDQGLKVTVFVNNDGSPIDEEGSEHWAKGITFDHLHK